MVFTCACEACDVICNLSHNWHSNSAGMFSRKMQNLTLCLQLAVRDFWSVADRWRWLTTLLKALLLSFRLLLCKMKWSLNVNFFCISWSLEAPKNKKSSENWIEEPQKLGWNDLRAVVLAFESSRPRFGIQSSAVPGNRPVSAGASCLESLTAISWDNTSGGHVCARLSASRR